MAAALAGCDANRKADLASLLNFPAPTTTAKPESKPAVAAPQAAATPTSPKLARFHDMKAAEVEALVGDPDFRRVEPPAELWQYRTAECVVDLFFYGDTNDRRVVHADSRSRDPASGSDGRCGDGSDVLKDRLRG